MYMVKALVGWLLPPGLFVILLVVLGYLSIRHYHRTLTISLLTIAALLYLCSIPLIADALVRPLETSYSVPKSIQGDVLVMLGGGATIDTPDVDGRGMLSGSAANRLLTVARLYNLTKLPIVVSGGQVYPDSGTEADIASRQLQSLGVPASAIYVENRSRNTKENAEYTKVILEQHHFQHPVLITSAFHMRRSVLDFGKAGISVTPYPCDYQTSLQFHWYPNLLVPDGYALYETWTALHEYLGIIAAHFG